MIKEYYVLLLFLHEEEIMDGSRNRGEVDQGEVSATTCSVFV